MRALLGDFAVINGWMKEHVFKRADRLTSREWIREITGRDFTPDDYLDYLRLLRSMFYLQSQPMWGIAACAQQAGFTVIRTYNRKFQDALGMTPHEFRMMITEGRNSVQE